MVCGHYCPYNQYTCQEFLYSAVFIIVILVVQRVSYCTVEVFSPHNVSQGCLLVSGFTKCLQESKDRAKESNPPQSHNLEMVYSHCAS